MKKYDVLIVGGSTTGSWFAKQMAQKGHKVLVIEKEETDNISRAYDIFHMGKDEMTEFGLTIPEKDDISFGFTFDGSPAFSPYGNYPKKGDGKTVVGLHKHEYILKMQEEAKAAGAEIIRGAAFTDFIKDDEDKIIGMKYKTAKGEKEAYGKIVADCSGIPSVARRKMPDNSTVENFKITNKDIFYVVLYYVKYVNDCVKPKDLYGFFLNYKAWSAPSGDEHGAILGIGGSCGYDYAEAIFEDFKKNVPWPEYTVEKIEKGMTPYHRAIYSFVDDGFIAMGDTACLTKPNNGEGCTSSLVQGTIAVEVIDELLKADKPLSKENLWKINRKYIKKQGTSFDSMRPLLMGFITPDYNEAEYMFSKDILYSRKILCSGGKNLEFTSKDIQKIVTGILKGVATGKIKASSVAAIVKGILNSGKIVKLYNEYPSSPEGYFEWKEKADALWEEIGGAYDTCDPELLRKFGY